MPKLDWGTISDRHSHDPFSKTKTGKPFKICRITDSTLFVDLPCGEQSVSRTHLEEAVRLISQGTIIEGPTDYKRLVFDERPAYAWVILRERALGFNK